MITYIFVQVLPSLTDNLFTFTIQLFEKCKQQNKLVSYSYCSLRWPDPILHRGIIMSLAVGALIL